VVDDNNNETRTSTRRRSAYSMLGPVILITAGSLVLLSNLNRIPNLQWQAAVRLWPLLLIFIGLDLVVRQIRRPIGLWLSLVISHLCAAVYVYILIFAGQMPTMAQLSGMLRVNTSRESLSFSATEVTAADIKINFGTAKAQVKAMEDNRNILEADVTYLDKLIYETNVNGGKVKIILDSDDDAGWFYWLNPASWLIDDVDDSWHIFALSHAVPINLDLDLNAGAVNLVFRPTDIAK